jgi:hypothetical protein
MSTRKDGAAPSTVNARATSVMPRAVRDPTLILDKIGPVAALAMTEAATPNARNIPKAPTGSWKLSCIEGHNRPRVEPGKATLRYAKQARRKGRTVKLL